MEAKRFDIVPAGKQALLFPLFLAAAVIAGLSLALSVGAETPLPWPVWVACTVMLLLVGVFTYGMFHRDVQLTEKGLRLRALPWPGTTPVAQLDLGNAEIVDLSARSDLMPRMKIIGTRLPGFRSGLFWLRDRRRATVLLTDLRRVLLLPRRDGTVLLLSVQRPEALLDALRRRG